MKKAFICFLILTQAAAMLCGCQTAKAPTVVGEGVRSQLPNREKSAQPDQSDVQILQHCDDFKSSDGTVEFHFFLDQEIPMAALPMTEVKPHILTGGDARRIAQILLPGADFYEQENSTSPKFSKDELEAAIDRLHIYTDMERLRNLLGEHPEDIMEYVQTQLDYFQEQLALAPEENPHVPCDWMLKKQRHYRNHPLEIGDRKPEDDDNILDANAHVDGVDYKLYLSQCNFPDRKLNSLSLSIHGGIGFLDQEIFRAGLCRTAEPTQAQLTALEEKAQNLLNQMEVGEFQVLPAQVDTKSYLDVREYVVWVDAVPVLSGIPAMKDQYRQMGDYFITSARFGFSPAGDLLYFDLTAPVEAQPTEKTVEPMPIQALAEKAKTYLTSLGKYSGLGCDTALVKMWEELHQEQSRAIAVINQMQYGLCRVNISGRENVYSYVPALVICGTVDYLGVDSSENFGGTVTHGSENRTQPILWLNAVDGSVIQ